MNAPLRIAMWSGPRNISTAMMRSFGARADCAVTDEPFYGAFLHDTGMRQPMADQIIAAMDCDWQSVAAAMNGPVPGGKPLWYQKHMPHHMVGGISIADFPDHEHGFLIRDPARVVASHAAKRIDVTPEDLGVDKQLEYADYIEQKTGKSAIILDSTDISRDPESHLRALCEAMNIGWDSAMLSWEPGYRDTDGIWATHWYNKVIDTSGFSGSEDGPKPLTSEQRKIADSCRPAYEQMAAKKLQPILK